MELSNGGRCHGQRQCLLTVLQLFQAAHRWQHDAFQLCACRPVCEMHLVILSIFAICHRLKGPALEMYLPHMNTIPIL